MKVYLAVEEQYFDFADLGSPLAINVPLGITNNEDADLYFKALLESPPEGYSDYEKALGAVGAGSSKMALFTFSRDKPTAEAVEELFLRLIAYTDPDYTTPYGSLTAKIRLHLIDHNDPSWDVLVHNDFDNGKRQGWDIASGGPNFGLPGSNVIFYEVSGWSEHYISAPYGLGCGASSSADENYVYKDFNVPASYREAILILHVWRSSDTIAVKAGDKYLIPSGHGYPIERWIRAVCAIPTGATTRVGLAGPKPFWLDEVFCIAR